MNGLVENCPKLTEGELLAIITTQGLKAAKSRTAETFTAVTINERSPYLLVIHSKDNRPHGPTHGVYEPIDHASIAQLGREFGHLTMRIGASNTNIGFGLSQALVDYGFRWEYRTLTQKQIELYGIEPNVYDGEIIIHRADVTHRFHLTHG